MNFFILLFLSFSLYAIEVKTLKRIFASTDSSLTKIEAISQAKINSKGMLTMRVGVNSESKKPLGLNVAVIRGKNILILPVKLADKERIINPMGSRNVDLLIPLKELCFVMKSCKKKKYKVKIFLFIDKVFWKDYRKVHPQPKKYEQARVELLIDQSI